MPAVALSAVALSAVALVVEWSSFSPRLLHSHALQQRKTTQSKQVPTAPLPAAIASAIVVLLVLLSEPEVKVISLRVASLQSWLRKIEEVNSAAMRK